jgi:hypothetical protein
MGLLQLEMIFIPFNAGHSLAERVAAYTAAKVPNLLMGAQNCLSAIEVSNQHAQHL